VCSLGDNHLPGVLQASLGLRVRLLWPMTAEQVLQKIQELENNFL
jgi:hypothetical protein